MGGAPKTKTSTSNDNDASYASFASLKRGGDRGVGTELYHCIEEDLYVIYNLGGINYGPRHRCCRNTFKITQPGGKPFTAGALRMYEDAEDWEYQHRLHPGILDCALQ